MPGQCYSCYLIFPLLFCGPHNVGSLSNTRYRYGKYEHGSSLNEAKDDKILTNLISWMKDHEILSEQVKVSLSPSSSRYGVFATSHIKKSETISVIPRNITIQKDTCSISRLLESAWLKSNDGIVELIICLAYEYTNPQSRWKPYLDHAPSVEDLNQALFWTTQEIESYLKGVSEWIDYLAMDAAEMDRLYFEEIKPFINANRHVGFNNNIHTYGLLKHMNSFILAYGIQGYLGRKMMVPFADLINHNSDPNIELVDTGDKSLIVRSLKHICPGEELFFNYGNFSNARLLALYGFVPDDATNLHDFVDVSVTNLHRAAERIKLACVPEKIHQLRKFGLSDDILLSIGTEGIVRVLFTEKYEEFSHLDKYVFELLIKILTMPNQDCRIYLNLSPLEMHNSLLSKDGFANTHTFLSNAAIAGSMSDLEKLLLRNAVEQHVDNYADIVISDSDNNVTIRKKKAAIKLISTQKQLLRHFLDVTTSI